MTKDHLALNRAYVNMPPTATNLVVANKFSVSSMFGHWKELYGFFLSSLLAMKNTYVHNVERDSIDGTKKK